MGLVSNFHTEVIIIKILIGTFEMQAVRASTEVADRWDLGKMRGTFRRPTSNTEVTDDRRRSGQIAQADFF